MLASIEANLGQLAAALEWSERTTRTDRMNPAHWYLRATILQERGDLDEAVTALKRVLYLDPDFVLAHFVLGNMTMQQGRKPQALRHFNIALSQLSKYKRDDILAGSDDLTANQLETIIVAMLNQK
jgi:chemotaxis protein methyltransferase CheR